MDGHHPPRGKPGAGHRRIDAGILVDTHRVLGGALILLGLFYNHFAPVLRRLLEDEKAGS